MIKKMKETRKTEQGVQYLYSFDKYKRLTYEQAIALQKKYHICKAQLRDNEELIAY